MLRACGLSRPHASVQDLIYRASWQTKESIWFTQHLTGKHEPDGLAQGALRAWCHDRLACVARQFNTSVAAAADAGSEGPPKDKLTAIPFKVRESSSGTMLHSMVTLASTSCRPAQVHDKISGLPHAGAPCKSPQVAPGKS